MWCMQAGATIDTLKRCHSAFYSKISLWILSQTLPESYSHPVLDQLQVVLKGTIVSYIESESQITEVNVNVACTDGIVSESSVLISI